MSIGVFLPNSKPTVIKPRSIVDHRLKSVADQLVISLVSSQEYKEPCNQGFGNSGSETRNYKFRPRFPDALQEAERTNGAIRMAHILLWHIFC